MCTDQISDRKLFSKSRSLRMSDRAACRFWLTITKVARKIASRLTTMVSNPKGNSSNFSAAPNIPTLTAIQMANHAVWM